MDAILPAHQVSDEDTYNRFLKRKGPSVVADFIDGRGDFGRYLRQIAPMGAPALRCWADWEPEPCPLPLIAPLLAPRTLDGLPAWWSHLEPAWAGNWQPRGPQRQGQRTGRVRRDLL